MVIFDDGISAVSACINDGGLDVELKRSICDADTYSFCCDHILGLRYRLVVQVVEYLKAVGRLSTDGAQR